MSKTIYRQLLIAIDAIGIAINVRSQLLSHAEADFGSEFSECFLERLEAACDSLDGLLLDDLETLYAHNLTPEEAQGLLDFYTSPLGRRIIALQPVMITMSGAMAQTHGYRVEKLMRSMLEAEASLN